MDYGGETEATRLTMMEDDSERWWQGHVNQSDSTSAKFFNVPMQRNGVMGLLYTLYIVSSEYRDRR